MESSTPPRSAASLADLTEQERAAVLWLATCDGFRIARCLSPGTLRAAYADLVRAGQYTDPATPETPPMQTYQVTFTADISHYKQGHKVLHGEARACMPAVPTVGMHVGPGQLLTVCQVHWLGGNEFRADTELLYQQDRAVENARYASLGLKTYPDLWADRAAIQAAVDAIPLLTFEWREEDEPVELEKADDD